REATSTLQQASISGYGEVTALAIWRDLTILYDPASDTFTIPVYDNQEFHRISKIPEEPGIV
ncbi:MAG TPA: hypothetical protein PLK38_08315, partial [Methanoregulaceae archaeon]|nr:hypothetical protein [Methanoregulaceae archaeon]